MKNHRQVMGLSGHRVVKRGYLSGQSLIEVIVSVSIAVIVAIALISMSIITGRAARAAKNNTQATKLAEEYIEQIRAYRDRNGFSVVSANVTDYHMDVLQPEASWLQSGVENITIDNTVFTRKLSISDGGNADKKKVTVTVNWTAQGGVQAVANETYLTKWDVF
jgi:type II secretory pathway pseudopilin PulG